MEQTFQKLQQEWEARLFKLDKYILPPWQHCKPLTIDKPTGGSISDNQSGSQQSCINAGLIITGETE